MAENERYERAIAALRHLLTANKLFDQPDFVHDPDTEWEAAMDEAEAAIKEYESLRVRQFPQEKTND